MGEFRSTKNTHPERKNQHSFSSENQPSRKGKRKMGIAKKTVARRAFEDMGYNPMETQIQMVQKYQEMLSTGVGWDGKTKLTSQQRDGFANQIIQINKDLMQYQTTKATAETPEPSNKPEEIEQNVEDNGPLSPSDLLSTKKKMASRRLEDKIGKQDMDKFKGIIILDDPALEATEQDKERANDWFKKTLASRSKPVSIVPGGKVPDVK